MIDIIPITSLDLPALQSYKTLRQPVEHFHAGIFIAEGEKVVQRLLSSSLEVLSALVTPEWLDICRPLFESHRNSFPVYVAQKTMLESIVGYNLHQGIMAMGKIPMPALLDDVIPQLSNPLLFVALDGLTNSENIGVVVRNCAAFGVHAIIAGETSSSPYLRRAVRNSMGTVFKIPIIHSTCLAQTLETLRTKYRTKIIAAHPHAEKQSLPQTSCRENICIVLGSEGEGISQNILSVCDQLVAVPMAHGVDSLNVASASAVFLYEVLRQRSMANELMKG